MEKSTIFSILLSTTVLLKIKLELNFSRKNVDNDNTLNNVINNVLEKDDVIDLTQSPQLLPEAFWLPPEF